MKVRRFLVPLVAVLSLGLMAESAAAASPHFIRASASIQGLNLVVSFKEAGLGDNQNIDYLAAALAVRVDSCVNNGGNIPSDPKKTTTSAEVDAAGTFSVQNGQVVATLTLSPPATTLVCPNGQHATLQRLEYSDVRITDLTDGVFRDIAGTFSA